MGEVAKRWEGAAYLPLAITLWLTSTLFLGGDLGKYADDYFFGGRDPVTAEPFAATSLAERPFRRPLTWILVTSLHRQLWFHDAALHALNAFAHGLVAVLLVRFLRTLGLSRGACVAAGLLFLVYPAHYEVVLWSSALATALASATFLAVCQLTVRRAQRDGGAGTLLAIAALSLLIPCWNEQPAAGVAALPLLHVATAAERSSRRRLWRRGVAAGLAASAGVLLYGALFWSTTRPGMRGTLSTMSGPTVVAAEAGRIAREAASLLSLHDLGAAALAEGLRSLLASPWSSAALLGAALASGWIALQRFVGGSEGDLAALRDAAPRRGLLLVFAVSVFVLDWVPLLAARGMTLSSRLLYAPAVALAMTVAIVLDALAGAPIGGVLRARRRLVAAALALPLGLGCIAMVGLQAGFQARSRADAKLIASLRRSLPEPPAGTLVLALDDESAPGPSGAARAMGLLSPFAFPQAATVFVRWGYRRNDLFAAQVIPDLVSVVSTPAGVEIAGLDPAFPVDGAAIASRGAIHLPWSRVVPVRIAADARVILEDRTELRATGRDTVTTGPAARGR